MSPLRWRLAGPPDAARLAVLGRRTFTETFGHLYRPQDLAAFLENHSETGWARELSDPRFAVRLGESAGEAVAYAKLGPPSLPVEESQAAAPGGPGGSVIELRQFYLLAPWHGTGAARDLMNWVLDEARRRGAGEIRLSVFVDNHRARRFYERFGFDYVGRYAFIVGEHADEDLIMRRSLSS